MHGDVLCYSDGLKGRLDRVVATKARLEMTRNGVQKDFQAKESRVKHLSKELEVLNKVQELLRILMDRLVESQVRSVESIVNEGLAAVFPKEALTLEADVDPKYNQVSVDFFFRKGAKEDPKSYRDKPLMGFGGGTTSFVSLVLRILTVKKLNLHPMLILDESLGAVSNEHIDSTAQFVRLLCETLGFDVLLVTHKSGFLEHAHGAYRCHREGSGDEQHVVMKKVL